MHFHLLSEKEKKAKWTEICFFWKIVDKEFVPPLSTRGESFKKKLLKNKNVKVITALIKKQIAGIVIYWLFKPRLKSSYIDWLIVKPEFRRKGIGTALMEKVIAELKDKRIKMSTYNTNPALKIYHKLGFKQYYIRKNAKGKGIDKIYLLLENKN